VEIHKPREKEKGISDQGNNNSRMERVLHETAGRVKGRRRRKNTIERETDGSGRDRNHRGRGGKTDKAAVKKERHRGGTGCRMKRRCLGPKEW
jgi:hypothetical protein